MYSGSSKILVFVFNFVFEFASVSCGVLKCFF
jgi:hypothetical protein